MRKMITLLIAALTTISLASASSALTKSEMESVSKEYSELETSGSPVAAKSKILRGKVVSVDHDMKTVTVKKRGWLRAQELTFAVEEQAVPHLADLKHGDWVDVTYVEADGKLIARGIVKSMEQGEQ